MGEVGVHRSAQKAVAEHARRKRREVAKMLLPERLRVFAEEEVFVFDGRFGAYPVPAARLTTRRSTWRGETASGLPSLLKKSTRKKAVSGSHGNTRKVERSMRATRIGVTRMPTRHPDVVVKRVGAVPAEDDIAKSQSPTRQPTRISRVKCISRAARRPRRTRPASPFQCGVWQELLDLSEIHGGNLPAKGKSNSRLSS